MDHWPAVGSETIPWNREESDYLLIPKSKRRRIAATYDAAIPATIGNLQLSLPPELAERLADARSRLARLDEQQANLSFNLPALLLRSESAASSQIENLTSSARNIALAELSSAAPKNARIIAGNIDAMRCALSFNGPLTVRRIQDIHYALLSSIGEPFAGKVRTEQVWVGGTPYSPHDALFVPPRADRVLGCLEDLCFFAQREDVDPLAKAALVHAQFETIHPFIDGNGRAGRTLIHHVLREDEILRHTTVPLSAGLLHDVDAYMDALQRFQQGSPEAIIDQFINAVDLSLIVSQRTSQLVQSIVEEWQGLVRERSTSKMHQLPSLLVEQPVVDSAYIAQRLGLTRRSAMGLINRAREYGILKPVGNAQRKNFYQAIALIEVLDEISGMTGIRRLLARNG